jgi:hypothetical protein
MGANLPELEAGFHRRAWLGVCPSNAILLRQTIRTHLRRSRLKKFLNVFQRIRSGFFEPVALHLPAAPMPRDEGVLGQTPSVFRHRMDISNKTVSEPESSPISIEMVIL